MDIDTTGKVTYTFSCDIGYTDEQGAMNPLLSLRHAVLLAKRCTLGPEEISLHLLPDQHCPTVPARDLRVRVDNHVLSDLSPGVRERLAACFLNKQLVFDGCHSFAKFVTNNTVPDFATTAIRSLRALPTHGSRVLFLQNDSAPHHAQVCHSAVLLSVDQHDLDQSLCISKQGSTGRLLVTSMYELMRTYQAPHVRIAL